MRATTIIVLAGLGYLVWRIATKNPANRQDLAPRGYAPPMPKADELEALQRAMADVIPFVPPGRAGYATKEEADAAGLAKMGRSFGGSHYTVGRWFPHAWNEEYAS